jgi:hypothetical protein
MITLKKNDKLIIIIAVAVIIIAAIGIAAYEPLEQNDVESSKSTMNMFTISWEEKTAYLSTISEYAHKRTPYEGNISIDQDSLKSINFNISWKDDRTFFLGRFGRDTLKIEITAPDGIVYEELLQSDGNAINHIEIIIDEINTKPISETIESKNLDEAEQKLKQNNTKDRWKNEEIGIKITVTVGEILGNLRPRDRGNSFDLEIMYNYYDGSVTQEEIKETGSDGGNSSTDNSEGEEYTPPYLSMILRTGSGRLI